MEHESLRLLKTLGDATRLGILRALREKDCYVELLAERMNLSPATVSFHLKKLHDAGLVDARREQYYTVYALRREVFARTLEQLIFPQEGEDTMALLREEQYRRKVLKTFMPNGKCLQMPAQFKKRIIIYREIFNRFDPNRTYAEKEVNAIISDVYEDYCTVRRDFIGLGWMQRSSGVYTVNPDPDFDSSEDIYLKGEYR